MSVLTPQCFGEGRLTSGGGRLSGVDVADDDDVDVNLFLTALLVSCLVGTRASGRLELQLWAQSRGLGGSRWG